MKKTAQSAFIFWLLISSAFAGGLQKYAGSFMYLGAGARGSALAGAYTALVNDATSTYWNPAGLATAKGFQVQFMHSKRFISSIQQNFLAASMPVEKDTKIGLALYYLTINGNKDSRFAFVNNQFDYSKVKLFNTGDYVLTLSYAKKFDSTLDYGVNVKLIYRDLHVETATGIGFDIGTQYKLDNFRFGAVLRDITTTLLAWSTGTKELVTPSLKLGAAYTLHLSSISTKITPVADINMLFEGRKEAAQLNLGAVSVDVLFGSEFVYNDLIAIRLGLDDLQRVNAGFGFNLPYVSVDYAFNAYSNELGDTHRISLNLFLNPLF